MTQRNKHQNHVTLFCGMVTSACEKFSIILVTFNFMSVYLLNQGKQSCVDFFKLWIATMSKPIDENISV